MTHWLPDLAPYQGHRYQRIAEAIRDAVQRGELEPDFKLMSHREMAWRLGVTIGTVARAYQLLVKWGLAYARVGDGTRIKAVAPDGDPVVMGKTAHRSIDFGLLLPSPLTDKLLRQRAFQKTLAKLGEDFMRKPLSGYSPALGYESHRRAGASLISRSGFPATSAEVVVTNGAQEAMHIVFSALTHAGDTIMTERVGYLGVKAACRIRDLHIAPVAMDDEGILPESLAQVAQRTGSTVLFLVPNVQNPTGATMSLARRQAIVDTCRRLNVRIIEDNPFWQLLEDMPPPIVRLAPERTFYITSLAKLVSPTMRVGYLRATADMVPKLEITKHALSLSSSSLQAEVARHWISTGILDELIAWQRQEMRVRWQLACQHLAEHGIGGQHPRPFIWLKLPTHWSSIELVAALRAENITCIDSSHFSNGTEPAPQALRISLSTPLNQRQLQDGLATLSKLLAFRPPVPLPFY